MLLCRRAVRTASLGGNFLRCQKRNCSDNKRTAEKAVELAQESGGGGEGQLVEVGHKVVEPWEDPYRYALGEQQDDGHKIAQTEILDDSEELWKYVERLFPQKVIPPLPKHDSYPTPSGWRPPHDPPPNLPYRVNRNRLHTFPLFLESRRDQLDTKTLEFDYVELVKMTKIEGDVFACERDLVGYLEKRLGRKVATFVNELHGTIRVKGADRVDLEAFMLDTGF